MYMHISIYVCIYRYIYICIYIYIYISSYVYIHRFTYICTYIHTYMHVCIYISIYKYMYVYIHLCIYIYIHIHKNIPIGGIPSSRPGAFAVKLPEMLFRPQLLRVRRRWLPRMIYLKKSSFLTTYQPDKQAGRLPGTAADGPRCGCVVNDIIPMLICAVCGPSADSISACDVDIRRSIANVLLCFVRIPILAEIFCKQ